MKLFTITWIALVGFSAYIMAGTDILGGAFVGIVLGTVFCLLQAIVVKVRLDKLMSTYEQNYGPHPGYTRKYLGGTTAGSVVGAVAGNTLAGGFVGGAIGTWLDERHQKKLMARMPEEQAALYGEIKAVRAMNPAVFYFTYCGWVFLMTLMVYLWSAVVGG